MFQIQKPFCLVFAEDKLLGVSQESDSLLRVRLPRGRESSISSLRLRVESPLPSIIARPTLKGTGTVRFRVRVLQASVLVLVRYTSVVWLSECLLMVTHHRMEVRVLVFSFELLVVRFPEIAQASSSLLGCCNHHHHHLLMVVVQYSYHTV